MKRIILAVPFLALAACAGLTPEMQACYAEHGVNAIAVEGDRIMQGVTALTECGIVTEAE